jgi:hypothetical protein
MAEHDDPASQEATSKAQGAGGSTAHAEPSKGGATSGPVSNANGGDNSNVMAVGNQYNYWSLSEHQAVEVVRSMLSTQRGTETARHSPPPRMVRRPPPVDWPVSEGLRVLPNPLSDLLEGGIEKPLNEAITRAADHLFEKHILVIECIDSELQWAAAAEVIQRAQLQTTPVRGLVSGSFHEPNETATNGAPEEDPSDWTPANIIHPQIKDGPCVMLLVLQGERGQKLIDRLFQTDIKTQELSNKLGEKERHLILLPRGSVLEHLRREHSQRGFLVEVLQIRFLELWLRRHFPEEAAVYAAKLQKFLEREGWDGNEEEIYKRLAAPGTGEVGRQRLRDLLQSGDLDPEALITRVRKALDATDGADEALLTAVFVATFLPRLSQHDFVRAVEKLLEGRERTEWSLLPLATPADGNTRPVQTRISLAKEWRERLRPIMKSAHLELQLLPDGSRVIDFQGLGTASMLKPRFEEAPMFLDQQIERIRTAGLLFDRSEALSHAVIELVTMAATQDPIRYNAEWILGMLFRIDPETQDIPLTEDTAGMHLEMLGTRHLAGASSLLRRLINAGPASASGLNGQLRQYEPSLVNAIFEKLLRVGATRAATLLLELAWQLRDAPGFDLWHWIRQVIERGNDESRDRAVQILQRSLQSEASDASVDFERLKSWLPKEKQGGGWGSVIAQRIVAGWCIASIHFASGIRSQSVSAVESFLKRFTARGGAVAIRSLVTVLLRREIVKTLFTEHHTHRGELLAVFLLPPDKDSFEVPALGAWLEAVVGAWNKTVNELGSDIDNTSFPHYLLPVLTLAAWCELFAEHPDATPAIAAALRSALDEEQQGSVQLWLGILGKVMLTSEAQVLEQPRLGDSEKARILDEMATRRERIEQLQTEVNQSALGESSHGQA